jgi:type II secretory pathway pseudopilin PulG
MIELLVALVISGILASVMFQVMAGQGRFVEVQSAREEVQQNARVATELIGSELRTVPRGGLETGAANSITIRAPRLWGVVCDASGGTYNVTFPRIGGATFGVNAGTHLAGEVQQVPTTGGRVSAIGAAAATCDGRAISTFEGRSVTLLNTPLTPSNASPQPGDPVYLYDQVTYLTGTSVGIAGTWIMRRLGTGAAQPMAGPIASGEGGEPVGLRFVYFEDGSAAPLATPVTNPDIVSRVMMIVRAESRPNSANARQWQEDTVMISLRNRVQP